ncbi:MAG: LysM peptidoglycan-binding domain-containing protein [Pseudomonadota bacterium]
MISLTLNPMRVVHWLAVLAFALMLSACGGDEADDPADGASSETEVAGATPDEQAVSQDNSNDQAPAADTNENDDASADQSIEPVDDASPNDNGKGIPPSFDIVRISSSGSGVIAGRAAPDAVVYLYADNRRIAEVKADARGEWVLILETPFPSGSVEIDARASGNGETELLSSGVIVLHLPEREGASADDGFADASGSGVMAVLSPRNGEGASRILQRPTAVLRDASLSSLAIDAVDFQANGGAIVSGSGISGAVIELYLDNQSLGRTTVDENGRWQVVSEDAVEPGERTLRADQVDREGAVDVRVEQPFDTRLPLDPAQSRREVIVQPGNSLWYIARKLYGEGYRYSLIFQANADQIRDPDLIYPGQTFALPASKSGG